MENETPRTIEQIRGTIRSARDSVWVITDEIEKLNAGGTPNKNVKGNIDRNVSHLKLVVADQEIIDSDEDIADLTAAITTGGAKLAEDIWSADEDTV
jgi:hypothetical protein